MARHRFRWMTSTETPLRKDVLQVNREILFVNSMLTGIRIPRHCPMRQQVHDFVAVRILDPFGCLTRRTFPNPAHSNQVLYSVSVYARPPG